MPSNIKEIANRAGLSIATVSRALNGSNLVKEKTTKLVKKIADELNYKPNLLAQSFVKRKSSLIALIIPEVADEYFMEIIRGVDEVTFNNDYFCMVLSSHANRTIEESIDKMFFSGLIGGAIILVPSFPEKLKARVEQSGIPYVVITGGLKKRNYNSVSLGNSQGIYDMVNYLYSEKGYRKFGFISGPLDNNDAISRKDGFLDACEVNNIIIEDNMIYQGDFTMSSGYNGAAYFSELQNKPEVILSANDVMAIGFYDYCKENGIKIPDGFAITGFDDIKISQYLTPPLSTVSVDICEIGKKAASILVERLEGNNINKIENYKIPTRLEIRESC